MKELFVAIQNKLMADVPELKMIDFDLGQLEQTPLPPLDFPAVLISFGESPFTDLGGLSQEANVQVILRIAHRVFERTHNIAQDQFRAIGLAHLDINDSIKWNLHGLEGDNFQKISHRGFGTEPRSDLRVYQMTFETLMTVTPPSPQYVPWTEGGGVGAAPGICIVDENNEVII